MSQSMSPEERAFLRALAEIFAGNTTYTANHAGRRAAESLLASEGAGSPRAPKRFPVGHGNDCSCEKCMEVWEGAAPEPEKPRRVCLACDFQTYQSVCPMCGSSRTVLVGGAEDQKARAAQQGNSSGDSASGVSMPKPTHAGSAAPSSLPEVQQYNEFRRGTTNIILAGMPIHAGDVQGLMNRADAMRDALLQENKRLADEAGGYRCERNSLWVERDALLARIEELTKERDDARHFHTNADKDRREAEREVASLQRQVSEAKPLPE